MSTTRAISFSFCRGWDGEREILGERSWVKGSLDITRGSNKKKVQKRGEGEGEGEGGRSRRKES